MAERPRVRLITMAWGERYTDELFGITLPAALAPGNLPALVEAFDCDVVILNEEHRFDQLRQHPVYKKISELCPVELRPLDEYISRPDAYGLAVTYSLFRGFEDLGAKMLDTYMVFLNSDFVLADGSFRTVARKIQEGERLIFAPSYCVVLEDVAPQLLERRNPESWAMTIPPRELARFGIENRHNTIRGKTVNQRTLSMEWIDQLYWLVDRQTLLCHQMPIAVVCMRPERVLTDMVTFWDYGIVAEACPTTPRCVLGDSDDFLMIELRGANTAREQLRLGWSSTKQIAGKLYRFITADPVELARYPLVLHSSDLPPSTPAAAAKLSRFVDRVLTYLPSQMDYNNHYIWAYHYPTFHKLRREYLAGKGIVVEEPGSEKPPVIPSTESLEAAFEAGAAEVAGALAAKPPAPFEDTTPRAEPVLKPWQHVRHRLFGPDPTSIPWWPDLLPIRRAWAARPHGTVLVVSSDGLSGRLFEEARGTQMRTGDLLPAAQDTTAPPRRQAGAFDFCVCELGDADLLRLRSLVEAIRPLMRVGGKVMVFYRNQDMGPFALAADLIKADALALAFPCRLYAAQTLGRADQIRAYEQARTDRGGAAKPSLSQGVRAMFAALTAATRTEPETDVIVADRLPDECTSLTIDIDVTA